MRIHLLSALLLAPLIADAQVYKCTDAAGQVTFAYTPCQTQDGVSGLSESVTVQTNEINGTFATQEQIQEHLTAEQQKPNKTKVTVVTDSSTEDPNTLGGLVNLRLRQKEERLEQLRGENTSGVTVVHDRSREGQLDRALRLKQEAAALNYSGQGMSAPAADPVVVPPQIDDREVAYEPGQDPLKRRLQQVQNKMEDPRTEDFDKSFCREGRPRARDIVKFMDEEIWPGMNRSEVQRLIGSPSSVNSVIVGQEQWSYYSADTGTILVYMQGQCVRSIQ